MKNKNSKIYWIWLSLIFRPASRGAVRLLRYFDGARDVFRAGAEELLSCGAIKERDRAFSEILRHDLSDAEDIFKWCSENKVDIITPEDKNYPANLFILRDAPLVLYCVGRLPDFKRVCSIAVVGSRRMSDYGKVNSFVMGYGLAKAGAVVISGLAYGVDGMAMASAVEAGGVTVGVLGCGIDVVYPKEHRDLFKASLAKGAIITEYPPGERPNKGNFPTRNRIISCLSQGTVIVEATDDGGSLITARHALYQGKDLFAIPGSVTSPTSAGTNHLLKEGAFAATEPADVLERYEYVYPHTLDLSSMEKALLTVDAERSAQLTALKYGITTPGERRDVYSSGGRETGRKSISIVQKGEPSDFSGFIFDEDVEQSEKPSPLPARKSSGKSTEKKPFATIPEPKRIDFELLNETDIKIYNAMKADTPLLPEELISDGLSISDVMSSLTMLEISGAVECGAGGYFMKCSEDVAPDGDEE